MIYTWISSATRGRRRYGSGSPFGSRDCRKVGANPTPRSNYGPAGETAPACPSQRARAVLHAGRTGTPRRPGLLDRNFRKVTPLL